MVGRWWFPCRYDDGWKRFRRKRRLVGRRRRLWWRRQFRWRRFKRLVVVFNRMIKKRILNYRMSRLLKRLFVFSFSLLLISAVAQKPVPELWGLHVHDEAHALQQS